MRAAKKGEAIRSRGKVNRPLGARLCEIIRLFKRPRASVVKVEWRPGRACEKSRKKTIHVSINKHITERGCLNLLFGALSGIENEWEGAAWQR